MSLILIHNIIGTKNHLPKDIDAIVLPGGFSYGDRLSAGVIAAHSPMIKDVQKMAKKGIPVLGVCNGFQILVESGLLAWSFSKTILLILCVNGQILLLKITRLLLQTNSNYIKKFQFQLQMVREDILLMMIL